MILEGILTTLNEDGSANIAPQGPIVDEHLSRFVLRPYQLSTTFQNLHRAGEAVFHVTDDVELLARAAINRIDTPPRLVPARGVRGLVLADACRWYALRVESRDVSRPRGEFVCRVVDGERMRDFLGFNRAKHAVVEAAILATRVGIVPDEEISAEFRRLAVPVEKTAGDAERRAFAFLEAYVREKLADRNIASVHEDPLRRSGP